MSNKYQELGASASKEGLHSVLKKTGLESSSEYFSPIFPDPSGDENLAAFLHCDGSATKSIVAYLMYKETGDPAWFSGLAQDALVMNLDDIYCIGTPNCMVLSNLVNRNSKLVGDDILEVIICAYKILLDSLSQHGIDITFAGGETADVADLVRTVILDAVISGNIKKENLINTRRIVPGDIIVGLSNTGKTIYENEENSSIGSNGLTLARHALITSDYREKYPETCDPSINAGFKGPFHLTDEVPELGMSIGKALLSPTRTYAPVLKKILTTLKNEVHGLIHLTGGGQTKVLRFGKGNKYIKDNLFPTPPLFSLIQENGDISWQEMYRVFNMGHRMEIYLPKQHLQTIIDIAKEFNIEAKQVGYVEGNEDSKSNKVIVKTSSGTFNYSL